MVHIFAKITGVVGRFFYAQPIIVSESPTAVYPYPELVWCDLSHEMYCKEIIVSINDVVILEYNPNWRESFYYIIERLEDTRIARIVGCGLSSGMLQAKIYRLSDSQELMYPTDEVVTCIPICSYKIYKDMTLPLHDEHIGDFVLLQGKIHYIKKAYHIDKWLWE